MQVATSYFSTSAKLQTHGVGPQNTVEHCALGVGVIFPGACKCIAAYVIQRVSLCHQSQANHFDTFHCWKRLYLCASGATAPSGPWPPHSRGF